MVSQRMLQLGTARSVIRELFEYGRQRAAEACCGSRGIPSTATPAPPVIPVPGSALPIP